MALTPTLRKMLSGKLLGSVSYFHKKSFFITDAWKEFFQLLISWFVKKDTQHSFEETIRYFTNFTKFKGKHLYQSLSLRPATLLKKRLWYRCFPVNFVKFLRTPSLQNTSGRLLLPFFTYTAFRRKVCYKNFFC